MLQRDANSTGVASGLNRISTAAPHRDLAFAGTGLADPNLPTIPRHFIVSPTGERIEVAPRVCDGPALQKAFNHFDSNVHHAVPARLAPARVPLACTMGKWRSWAPAPAERITHGTSRHRGRRGAVSTLGRCSLLYGSLH